jgi:hypothetical protein
LKTAILYSSITSERAVQYCSFQQKDEVYNYKAYSYNTAVAIQLCNMKFKDELHYKVVENCSIIAV